jgi:glutamate racemase
MAIVNSTIGIFDSGIGGLAVLAELERLAPGHPIVYLADQAWMPYGERSLEEVRVRSETMTRQLLDRGAEVIVVACNSASAAALHPLRRTFPHTPFVGMEPAVKPAAEQTGRGIIGVLATNATFQGELYGSVVDRHASEVSIVAQACPGLAMAVERGDTDTSGSLLAEYLPPLIDGGADTVVLGCTHYSFLVPQIKALIGPDVQVIDPAPAVARQVLRVLPGSTRTDGHTEYLTTGDPETFAEQIASLRDVVTVPERVVVQDLAGAMQALREGRVVGVPTDTVYGVAVDPLNPEALAALADLKGRAPDQPFPVLVASIDQALELGAFDDAARRLATDHWPGPLTLVVPSAGGAPDHHGTVGLRVPAHPTTLALLSAVGPLAVTSANLSGEDETLDADQARAIFGSDVAVYIEGQSPGGTASTVIDCTGQNPVILRRGPVG